MTDSSDATVMNPGKRRAGAAAGGPYHLHVGHRPEAGHVDVCFDFCHGACGTRRGAGSGVARPVPLGGGGRRAGGWRRRDAGRQPRGFQRPTAPSRSGGTPIARITPGLCSFPDVTGASPLYLQIPAGACCRSRPTACRGSE